ncbi:unnamed protein product [Phytophthora lilii]|uniref:Unnamed protein product n=1 Tax=Phytophthora lilii TaxID=2077276 RepID=A0A9W6U9H0_9STRA|nr:unnamed protein product [Phytophthora lilii]
MLLIVEVRRTLVSASLAVWLDVNKVGGLTSRVDAGAGSTNWELDCLKDLGLPHEAAIKPTPGAQGTRDTLHGGHTGAVLVCTNWDTHDQNETATPDEQDDNKVAVTATSSGLWSGCDFGDGDDDDAGGRPACPSRQRRQRRQCTSLPPASPVAARPTRPGARARRGATRAASGSGSSDTGGDDSEDGGLDPSQSGGGHASISDDDSSSSDDSNYCPGDDEGDHGSPSDDDRDSTSSDIDPRERSARSRRTAAARRRVRTRSRAPRRGSDEDSDGPDESRRSWKRSVKDLELMPFKPSPTMSVSTWIAKVDLALRGTRVAGRGSWSDEELYYILGNKLQDNAGQWYVQMDQELADNEKTWPKLKAALLRRYGERLDMSMAEWRVSRRHMMPGETYADFAAGLRDLTGQNHISERVLLAQFYRSLDKTTRQLVKQRPKPRTLKEAVDKATEIDDPIDNVAQGMKNIGQAGLPRPIPSGNEEMAYFTKPQGVWNKYTVTWDVPEGRTWNGRYWKAIQKKAPKPAPDHRASGKRFGGRPDRKARVMLAKAESDEEDE